ncbi:type II secretion system minor pseudopilin GspI [Piscinibacterium candidicorallinum]
MLLGSSRTVRGFTLIEVLVALAIVALALLAGLRAAGQLGENTRALNIRTMALWSADNRLAEIRLSGAQPVVGTRNFPCPQADQVFECEERVTQTPNPFFVRVEVSVFDNAARNQELAMLSTVVGRARQ